MENMISQSEIEGSAAAKLDKIAEWLMIALLAFMPVVFGAVHAWSMLVVVIITGAMAVCVALRLAIYPKAGAVWTWAYVPVALFGVLVLLQLVPLPPKVVGLVSSNTVATKHRLLGDLYGMYGTLDSMTLSFYPLATRQDFRLLLVVASVFAVTVNVYRSTEQIKRLLGAVAMIGGAIALLALAQNVLGADRIYWIVPSPGNAQSGTFANHSHYGQFMNLSIGAALGLIFVKLHEAFGEHDLSFPEALDLLRAPKLRTLWYLGAGVVVGAATIFLSLTRGGMMSMLVAGGFTAMATGTTRGARGRSWIIVIMAVMAFICVLYLGFDAVYDHLATLRDLRHYEGRRQIVADLLISIGKFPVFGTGLGTHEVVYPMFDRSTTPRLAQYAENEYAQAAEETGLVGLGLILTFSVMVWRCYARSVRNAGQPVRFAAFGLGFGLLAIMIHSLSDFGQHLPANVCLTALSCGLLVVLGRKSEGRRPERQRSPRTSPTGVRAAGIIGIFFIAPLWFWAIASAADRWIAEIDWQQARKIEDQLRLDGWQGSDEQYESLLTLAHNALKRQPENVHYRHWFNVYRWQSVARLMDREADEPAIALKITELTRRIVADLHRARVSCPTFGPVYCVAGQLEKFILKEPQGADHIRLGYKLAPCNPTTTYVAGLLDVEERRPDEALSKFRRSLKLSGMFFRDIVQLYIRVGRPDLAVELAKDNTGWLAYVSRVLQETDPSLPLAAEAKAGALAMLKQRSQQPDAPAWVLAALAAALRCEKDSEAAIDCYRQALALEYGQVAWRLALAELLAQAGRVREATHHARICLRLRPGMPAAKRLIEKLSLRPDAPVTWRIDRTE